MQSEAHHLGLHPLQGTTEVKGVTGKLVPIQIAVVPELRIGKGRLRNNKAYRPPKLKVDTLARQHEEHISKNTAA